MSTSRHQAPNDDALVRLFRAQARGLAGVVRGVLGARAEPEELIQEVFLKAWRAREAGALPAEPKAWVYVALLNLAKDRRRARARRGPRLALEDAPEMQLTSTTPEPSARLERADELRRIRHAIHALSDEQREVFHLRVGAQLSFEEVGRALGVPVGTAKSRMRAALAALRASLVGNEERATLEGEAR